MIESLLRGERDTIWGLLSAIRETYPQTDQQNKTCFHLLNTGLQYSLTEMRRLESSLLGWLQSLHIVRPPPQGRQLNLLDIEHEVRNGTLLCSLASVLTRNVARLGGIIPDPRSTAAALSNLRKACECLRRLPKIGTRFLWEEKAILAGDRGTIFGLLEDLHRYYDGVAPSSSASLSPYYGRYCSAVLIFGLERRPRSCSPRPPSLRTETSQLAPSRRSRRAQNGPRIFPEKAGHWGTPARNTSRPGPIPVR